MLMRTTGMSILALLVPCALMAQESAPMSPVQEKGKTLEQLDQQVQQLRAEIEVVAEKQAEMLERLNDLATTQRELADMQREQALQQQEVLSSITQKDSSGTDVLRLNAAMQKSDEFRREMQKAVHGSLNKTGEVLIQNKMATEQRITVNQKEYVIGAGETLKLEVPVGTVTTQLPGQELMNWSVTPPEYKQTIDIVPESQSRVTAFRPSEPSAPVTTYYAPDVDVPVYTPPVETYYVEPAPIYWPLWPF